MSIDFRDMTAFRQSLVEAMNPLERKRKELRDLWTSTGDPRLGWEKNNQIVAAYLTIGNTTLPLQQRNAAQKYLDDLMYVDDSSSQRGPGSSGPSTAQNAAGIKAELENLAGLFGLAPQDWSDLSWQAAKNNWNAAMIRDAVADRITLESAQRAGLVKNVITKSRDVAANYFVQVGDEEALGWAKQIARGEMEEESIVAGLRDRAKAQYYWLAPAIDSGVTLKEYFQPHRETISRLMEVSADSIDFVNNTKWNKVVRNVLPDEQGVREMNLGEVEEYVRQQEEWKNTKNAKSSANGAVAAIGRIFGAI
jgi:hypothetical protein